MEPSRFNVISRIRDSEDHFILNALYGSADIIDSDTCRLLADGNDLPDEFISRKYIVDPDQEKKDFTNAYLRFLEERDSDEIQAFFVPWYSCNFNCSYCYQSGYNAQESVPGKEVTGAFFTAIGSMFSGRRKYITLFGGEPLLGGRSHRSSISLILEMANERKIDVAVVTNGYHVPEYIDLLRKASIREIQVTLDGIAEVHDPRRHLKNGAPSFERISRGIDLLLAEGIPVNLRVVVDRENAGGIPSLSRFAIERGWTASPLFKTQLGRNYELHNCQLHRDKLYSRLEMYQTVYELIKEYPEILEFHKPPFSVAGYLHETGELPPPLFDSCPGTKTEWAFDYTGRIYACTATVGKPGEELGTFFPGIVLNEERIDSWAGRDILSIDGCVDCNVALLCGGGCAAVAGNRTGSITDPDCRPVKELLELGISAYFNLPGR